MTQTAVEQESEHDAEAGHGRRRWWALVVFSYMALDGAALQMRGAVVPSLRATFGVPEWQLGLVAPAGTVGFLILVTAVGAVGGRFDIRGLLLVGIVGTGLGVLAMGVAPTFSLFLLALFGRGLFTGLGHGSDRPLLSHLYPTQRGRLFSYYDMMWAAGATVGPALVAVAVSLGNWRLAYFGLALAFVPLVALVVLLPTPDIGGGDAPLDWARFRALLREPTVPAMAVAVFLSASLEGGLFTWLTTYAGEQLPPSLATLSLSVMLAAYVPGRLITGRLTERVGYIRLAVAIVAATIPAFGYAFFVAEGLWLLVGLAAVGVTVSGFYPTMVAYGTEAVPQYSTPMNAIAAIASASGIAAGPAAMGFVVGDAGIVLAVRLLLGVLLALFAVVTAIWLVVGQLSTPE